MTNKKQEEIKKYNTTLPFDAQTYIKYFTSNNIQNIKSRLDALY